MVSVQRTFGLESAGIQREDYPVTAKVLLATLLVACAYDARYEDCAIRCSTDTGCPSDLTCGSEGLCRSPGAAETCTTVLETFPSCIGLAPTCGPNADEDCCATAIPIPGGTFFRSYDVAGDGMYSSMTFPATVSPFILDKYEVTVGRFRKFVEAGGGTQMNSPAAGKGARFLNGTPSQGGWDASWNAKLSADTSALVTAIKCRVNRQSWTDASSANEELPINCVTWYEAFAFCAWDGGFLPTEAEWNFAAAGGPEQRAYPWSDPASMLNIDCSFANYQAGGYCVNAPTGGVDRVGHASPKGNGKYGQTDLSGNVAEWTLDWYQNPYMSPCNDCADLTPASYKIFRGGGFYENASQLRGAYRNVIEPEGRFDTLGIRCARAL